MRRYGADQSAEAFEKMCAGYGFDVTRPAKDAREAVQFLYLAYLAAVKDQDGAAMSLGRTSTFLDIYIEKRYLRRQADGRRGTGIDRPVYYQTAYCPFPAYSGIQRPVLRRPCLGD